MTAILRDTGKKKGTGEACIVSSLPMPSLVEWLRLFGIEEWSAHELLPKKKRRKERKRHERIKVMWHRLHGEINAGPEVIVYGEQRGLTKAEAAERLADLHRQIAAEVSDSGDSEYILRCAEHWQGISEHWQGISENERVIEQGPGVARGG